VQDIERAAAAGFDAVLVGETFVRSPQPVNAVQAFLTSPGERVADFTRAASYVKICGVTSIHDAQVVIDAGADALGLIFAESTRQLSPSSGRRIAESSRGHSPRRRLSPRQRRVLVRCVDETGVDAAADPRVTFR